MKAIRTILAAGLIAAAAAAAGAAGAAGVAPPVAGAAGAAPPVAGGAPHAGGCGPSAQHPGFGGPGGGPGGWRHHRHGGRRGEYGWRGTRILHALHLTAAQQQAVHSIMTAAHAGFRGLHEQMRANGAKLRSITPDDPSYAAVVADVSRANGALFTQAIAKQADLRAQMYALLTPAQKKRLAVLRARMQARCPAA